MSNDRLDDHSVGISYFNSIRPVTTSMSGIIFTRIYKYIVFKDKLSSRLFNYLYKDVPLRVCHVGASFQVGISSLLCLESGRLRACILIARSSSLPELGALLIEVQLLVDLLLVSAQLGNLLITQTIRQLSALEDDDVERRLTACPWYISQCWHFRCASIR